MSVHWSGDGEDGEWSARAAHLSELAMTPTPTRRKKIPDWVWTSHDPEDTHDHHARLTADGWVTNGAIALRLKAPRGAERIDALVDQLWNEPRGKLRGLIGDAIRNGKSYTFPLPRKRKVHLDARYVDLVGELFGPVKWRFRGPLEAASAFDATGTRVAVLMPRREP